MLSIICIYVYIFILYSFHQILIITLSMVADICIFLSVIYFLLVLGVSFARRAYLSIHWLEDESVSLINHVPNFARDFGLLLLIHDDDTLSPMHLSSLLEQYSFKVLLLNFLFSLDLFGKRVFERKGKWCEGLHQQFSFINRRKRYRKHLKFSKVFSLLLFLVSKIGENKKYTKERTLEDFERL